VIIFPFALVSAIFNLVILLATAVNRKNLQRQYYSLVCVTNIIVGNIVFLIFEMWLLLDQYLGLYTFQGQEEKAS